METEASKPSLVFFYSPNCGHSRHVQGLLAHILQANRNQETFTLRTIDITKHPELRTTLHIDALPVLCVAEGGQIAARVDAPHNGAAVRKLLEPWLRANTRRD